MASIHKIEQAAGQTYLALKDLTLKEMALVVAGAQITDAKVA